MKDRNTYKKRSKRHCRHGHPQTGSRRWNRKRQSRHPSSACQRSWWTHVPWVVVWQLFTWLWDKAPLAWQKLTAIWDWLCYIAPLAWQMLSALVHSL
jgi:hypothetical protein